MKNKILQSGDEKVVLKPGLCQFYHLDFLKEGPPKAARSVDGFTLVEVIIVVVILAIAAMMAVPMMSSADTFQVRSAASMLASDLEYAKNCAISRGETFSVNFNYDNGYRLEDASGSPIEHPVKKGFDYVVDFASDGRLDKVKIDEVNLSDSIIEFDCLGSPDEGGTITLNAGGETIVVTVEPVTGYVSISN